MKRKCKRCGAVAPKDRLPRKWKEHDGEAWCHDCWRSERCLRAITLPVAGPIERTASKSGRGGWEPAGWPDLRPDLRESFSASTRVANWAVRQLALADNLVRRPGDEKIPKQPKIYLYNGAKELAPELASKSMVQLLNDVERSYSARRLDMWRGMTGYAPGFKRACSLPSYSYPTPVPIHNQSWHLEEVDGQLHFVTRIGQHRWRLRLRAGGKRYGRAAAGARKIAAGEVKQCVAVLLERRVGSDRHGSGSARDAGRSEVTTTLMVKLVAWFPRRPRTSDLSGDMIVTTNPDGLLRYLHGYEDDSPRWVRADNVPRLLAQRERLRQRLADDMDREKRVPTKRRRRYNASNHPRLARINGALDDAIKCAARTVVDVATRRRVARLVYDDSDRSFAEGLAWHALKTRIEVLCHEAKIDFIAGPVGALALDEQEAEQAKEALS